jgi:methionyl aminopeptidase
MELTKHEIECYKKAGRIAAETKTYARNIIKPGMKLIDIALAIDKKILELGGEFAFPVNLSLNDVAAHYTPTLGDETIAEGLLKIDIGVAVEGYIADTAISIDLTEEKKHTQQIEANKACLKAVMENIEYNDPINKIGKEVTKALKEYNEKNDTNIQLVESLCGHKVAQNIIHAGITIPNYENNDERPLKEMVTAIEPFLTTGTGIIYEGEGGGIYAITKEKKPRDPNARKILEYIKEKHKTRPFCSRWLEQNKELKGTKTALTLLEKEGIIHHYPILLDREEKTVTQFENTFIWNKEKKTITTYEENWENL